MPDLRTPIEKKLDTLIGKPLYYSSECLRPVRVTGLDNPVIERPCGDCSCQVIAPRNAIAAGEGGLNMQDRVRLTYRQIASSITGRCV